jgi:hypothetical protein
LPNFGAFRLQKDDPSSTPQIDAAIEASNYALWRAQVAGRLMDAGRHAESLNFQDCGTLFGNFNVAVCEADPDHDARALPFTCHLRYCPDCERREQARKVAKYVPILKDLTENTDRAGWSLKKIDLTTPYRLDDANAPGLYQDAWDFFETWLQLLFQQLLIDEMTPAEKRRQRISYSAHGVGALAAAEFGEHGHKLHFHCILYSPYVPKQMITDTWRTASGGECEVNWVRRIDYHDVDDAVREQVKYVTKFTELPPALVVQLADVLDGSRRLRTYGLVRKAEKIEPEPCKCSVCSATITVMKVREYFELVLAHNIMPKVEIFAAARQIFLDLKPGNNSGDGSSRPTARSDPEPPPTQADLPLFDEVFDTKKRFTYF